MIQSVIKAIEILKTFSSDHPVLTLTEISRKLGYPKSTVHTLISTLQSEGLIERIGNGSYALGTAIIPITQAVRLNVQLRDRAAPLLREVGDYCGESVYLTVLDGCFCLYIYAIESSHRLLARTAVGERAYLHCTSVGKAIMAFLTDERVEQIVREVGLPRFTDKTITDPAVLARELAEIRQRGFSLDEGEHEVNIYCVGAPIFNERGEVIASCSVSGPTPEIVADRQRDFALRIVGAAQEISRRMGFVPKAGAPFLRGVSLPGSRSTLSRESDGSTLISGGH
jgi:DNA-binding IclR family transcriptional regulator